MSDLLNQASLVMIPSGYKEDTVYSAVPTDGSGDLSFTRSSNGTRVNSAGLVEVCPWNLLQQSEDFSNGYWSKVSTTISANAITAPNGTTTADKIQETNVNDAHYISGVSGSMSTTNTYTFSGFFKAAERSYVWLYIYNGVEAAGLTAFFNLSDGTIGTVNAALTATITSMGDGWYRCTIARSITGNINAGAGFGTAIVNGTSSYTGTTGSGIYAWGAQLNIGSTAQPYFPTTDRLNVPRLTYQNGGGGCPSLLLEKQSTNINTYSNNISNASYNYQNASVSGITTTSPDGTSNSFGIVADTSSNNFHRWYKSFNGLSGTYTTSIYTKKGTSKYLGIGWNSDGSTGNNNIVVYDLDAGTISSNIYSITASIENVGNGWYKCIHTFNFGTGGSFADLCVHNAGLLSNYTAAAFQVYDTPSVSTTLYLWGIQVEASSYATSLIETTSSSATRVADACYKTGISSLIGQTEGVVFVDYVLNGQTNNANILNSEKNTTCSLFMGQQTDGNFDAGLYVNGSLVGRIEAGSISVGQRVKVAYAYKSGSFALYINGAQIGILSSTFTFPTTLDDIFLNDEIYFNYQEAVQYNQVALFKTRLTNAELASITSL